MVYSGIMDGERFWEGFSIALSKKYDLSEIGKVIIGGDAAFWVKIGGLYELDTFHLVAEVYQEFMEIQGYN